MTHKLTNLALLLIISTTISLLAITSKSGEILRFEDPQSIDNFNYSYRWKCRDKSYELTFKQIKNAAILEDIKVEGYSISTAALDNIQKKLSNIQRTSYVVINCSGDGSELIAWTGRGHNGEIKESGLIGIDIPNSILIKKQR